MISDKNKYWFIFYCNSRAEKKAHQILTEENYNVYLPLITEIHQWSDRKKKVQVPMFRGYIFVNCLLNQIHRIIQINHIVAPVKIGDEFAVLRLKDIELLRKIEEHGIQATAEQIRIQKGDSVGIKSGPLKGYNGICIQELGQNYVFIAIEAIDHYIKIKVHKGEILRI